MLNIDFDELSKEIFILHNKLRKDPKSFVSRLKHWLNKFRKKTLYLLNENPLETIEGEDAVKEAISFLETQDPVQELEFNDELSYAATDHAVDIGSHGLTGHEGSHNISLPDRIEKYIEWDYLIAENLDFGFKTPENILLNMIVDDGAQDRNQRMNLFSNEFKYIGIGGAKHTNYNYCFVLIYTKGLREKGYPPTMPKNLIDEYFKKSYLQKKIVNKFQEEDPDAPDDTIDRKVVRCTKMIAGKEKLITKIIYTLKDHNLHILEIEEN